MTKNEVKELVIMLVLSIINIFVAFSLTSILGISNTVIYKSLSLVYGDITWEVIIFMVLFFIEALMIETKKEVYE